MVPRAMSRGHAVVLMVLVAFMWSIAGLVTRQLDGARSFEVTFWRSAATALSLLIMLPVSQGIGAFARIPWRSPVLWVSGLCWSVMFTAFMLALTLTSVANVLIVMALAPLFTALLARIALKSPLPLRTWGAVLAAGAGIAFMYLPQIQSGASLLGSLVALAVPTAAAVQWTITQALQRSASRGLSVDLVPAVLIGALISSIATLPLAYPFAASLTDIAWLSLLGLVQLAIPCALSVLCARVLKGAEISLLALLEIIFGIALVWAFANEPLTARVLSGGSLVLLALAANEWLALKER